MSDVTKTCRDISELKPVAQVACNLFLAECKKAGLDIFITETYRSQGRQNYLYEQGRTRPGSKVTWTRNSRHTSRLAWDIAVNPPKNLYDAAVLKKAGEIARKLGITWGGDWTTSMDMPHFEVTLTWKAPVTTTKTEEKKENVRMFKPSTNTLKNEMLSFLERAQQDGILSSKDWTTKLRKGELSLDDALCLMATIHNRSK